MNSGSRRSWSGLLGAGTLRILKGLFFRGKGLGGAAAEHEEGSDKNGGLQYGIHSILLK